MTLHMVLPPGTVRHSTLFCVLALLLLLTSCASVGPDYVPPKTSLSPAWHTSIGTGLDAQQADPARIEKWWEALGDRELASLINRAVRNNLDIKQAVSRIRQARAQRSIYKAGLLPAVDASASATRSSGSENMGGKGSRTLYSAGFDTLWEIDLFGGVQRSVEAADADLQASIEDLHDVHVSLAAEVATNYIELRTCQSRLTVAETNLKNQEDTYKLTGERLQAGLADGLDVAQARAGLESTRSGIPSLRTGIEESKNRLAVLLGTQPGKLHKELEGSGIIPLVPGQIAVGVPADILRQRPDIRKAEQELIARTARVGVATADLYPKLKLSGTIGLEAVNSGSLLSAGARGYSYGPGISWSIFDAGAIRQNIEVSSARQEQALIGYELAVLAALEEVENRLTAYFEEKHRRDALSIGAKASKEAFDLAKIKYEAGLTDFTTLLDAQRSLLSLQDELTTCDGAVASDLVGLYKALGGGWPQNDNGKKTDSLSTTEAPSPSQKNQ
jgi:NodT family efflux transporter outer membrane factor (OMF) lipoprotein